MLKLCGALCITALLLRMILAGHGGWYFGFILCRMDCLAVGAAAAMLQRLKVKIPAWSIFLFAFGVVAAICVLRHTTDHADIWIGTIGFTAIAVAYGALLVLSLDPLSWLFSNAVLRFFGKYSYGLYLYHYPLTSVTDRFKPLSGHFPLGSSVAYVGGCMAINVAIAMLSFHLLEQPIRNWRRGARGQP
jgi:peptidoglycan/LPS O-acetylase OafA/YrhL